MDKKGMFLALANVLRKHAKGLELREKLIGSQAKGAKEQLHLYGKKKVSLMNLPARQIYIAGVVMQKNFVGFYSMPMYSHPKKLTLKHPLLKKMRKGKSCVNVTILDKAMLKELDGHVQKGIEVYKKEKWV